MADEVDRVEAAPERTPSWGLGDAALGFLVGVLLSAVVVGIWAGASGSTQVTLTAIALGEVGLWVGLVGAPVLASRRKGSRHLGEDFGFLLRPSDSRLGVPIGIASQLLLIPLVYVPIQWLFGQRDLSGQAQQLIDQAHGAGPLALLAVVLIVGAPVAEELFFRGLLLRALQRRFASSPRADGWAIAGSSVAFGLAHFELLQLPGLVLFGAVLGVLAVRTGRLGPGIWAHAAFNAVTVLLLAR
ncbi:MAG: protease family protein [Bradyrhizobium sp.]|nr:protease family protein [Bradyrhizobium sp.]